MGSAPSSLQRASPFSSCASVTANAPLYARKNLNELMPAAASSPMSAATCGRSLSGKVSVNGRPPARRSPPPPTAGQGLVGCHLSVDAWRHSRTANDAALHEADNGQELLYARHVWQAPSVPASPVPRARYQANRQDVARPFLARLVVAWQEPPHQRLSCTTQKVGLHALASHDVTAMWKE